MFDIIADAEEYGGAIQRHLGMKFNKTTRFGLPSNSDRRKELSFPLNTYEMNQVRNIPNSNHISNSSIEVNEGTLKELYNQTLLPHLPLKPSRSQKCIFPRYFYINHN